MKVYIPFEQDRAQNQAAVEVAVALEVEVEVLRSIPGEAQREVVRLDGADTYVAASWGVGWRVEVCGWGVVGIGVVQGGVGVVPVGLGVAFAFAGDVFINVKRIAVRRRG